MQKIKRTSKTGKTKLKVKTNSIRTGEGVFNFPNGDSYEGSYVVVNDKEIYRQDFGTYKTKDGDEYRAVWDKDCIGSNLHILYNNKAEYIGEIDIEGSMSGKGIYVFPDGSALQAIWKHNEPEADHVYTDTLGHRWLGKLSNNKQEVTFSPENYMWE